MVEVWLPVPEYDGLYEVSNLGRVRSARTGAVLAPSATSGYLHVSLCRNGEVRTARVHRIVLTAFCGQEPFQGAHAAHNDGNSLNCALTNLRWATAVENQADVTRHGRRCRGEDVYGAVLTEEKVRAIRARISGGERSRPIAQDYGVSISTIHLIKHNRIWRHVT